MKIQKVQKKKLDIVYEDEHILLINKPSGMLSQKAKETDESLVEYLIDYLLDSGHDTDTLLVEVSFYTLNAGYNTDRFATLEETLNNPLAYCLNLEYNVNALTVAMDTLKGTPDTIESGDWTAADYLADDGTTLPLHRKLYDYPAIITPKCRSWTLNEAQLTRLAELAARCQNEGIALTIVLPPMAENVRTEVCDPQATQRNRAARCAGVGGVQHKVTQQVRQQYPVGPHGGVLWAGLFEVHGAIGQAAGHILKVL